MYNTVAVLMGVSSLINPEPMQEENPRKHRNNGQAYCQTRLFTPAGPLFLGPKDSSWAGCTWSGHRDSPQPLQTCLFAHLAPWPHAPAGVGEQAGHCTQQAGWPLSPAPRGGPRRAGLGPRHPLLELGHRRQPLSTSGMRDGEGISF